MTTKTRKATPPRAGEKTIDFVAREILLISLLAAGICTLIVMVL